MKSVTDDQERGGAQEPNDDADDALNSPPQPEKPNTPGDHDRPGCEHSPGDSADPAKAIPDPVKAFVSNFTDPILGKDTPTKAKNFFTYGEALGRTLSGWRVKALALFFVSKDASEFEIAVTKTSLRGIGKGLRFIAPLSFLIDLADDFAKNRLGSAAFVENLSFSTYGLVGGTVGGLVFDTFLFAALQSAGLGGMVLFVGAPIFFGILGAALFQFAGSMLYHQTLPGTPLFKLAQSFFTWWSTFTSGGPPVANTNGHHNSKTERKPGGIPQKLKIRLPLPDNSSTRRRPPSFFGPPFPPGRLGPGIVAEEPPPAGGGGAVTGDDGDDGPGGGGSRAGGVLFKNCHTVLTGISELTGAYWDEQTQSLVLIGKDSENSACRSLALPAMDADHLKVALRAAILGESLGVSIDAPAEYRYGKDGRRMPPNGTRYFVSYLGGSAGTLSGAIFFEADRIMKCLSMGVHNETRKPFHAGVPGFRNTFDLHNQRDDAGGPSWHRFWFVIDHVELKKTPQTDAFTFGEVRIAIKTELDMRGGSPGQFNDPLDVQFADHLTKHYDEYAEEFPVFARLKELAKISALATFLVNKKIDLDLGEIFDGSPIEVATPETTPSLLRSETTRTFDGVHSYAMSGGVDFRIVPTVREDPGGAASRLRQRALAGRPTRSLEWCFREESSPLRAKAIKMGAARKVRLVETDHEFPLADGLPRLCLQRIYESKNSNRGSFGPGWTVFVPFSLGILHSSGKRREVLDPDNPSEKRSLPALVLRHWKSGSTQIYRPLADAQPNGAPAWGRLTSRNGSKLHFDPADLIVEERGLYVLEQSGRRYCFDQVGLLVEISCTAGILAKYTWTNGRLMRLENGAGHAYSIVYAEDSETVKNIQSSDGHGIVYVHGTDTLLKEVLIDSRRQFFYAYDLAGRLYEAGDSRGLIVRRFYYKADGDLINDNTPDTVDLLDGSKITRIFSENRLTSICDESGTNANFTYGPKGSLQSIFVKSQTGLNWRLEYDGNGKLRRIIDVLGRATEFDCDQQGQVAHVTSPNNGTILVKRNDQGRVVEVAASGDKGWKAIYGPDGELISFSGPKNPKIEIKRSRSAISGMKIFGECGMPSFAIGPASPFSDSCPHFQFGAFGLAERMSRRFVGRHRINCTLGSDGRSITTVGLAGTMKIKAGGVDSMTEIVEFL